MSKSNNKSELDSLGHVESRLSYSQAAQDLFDKLAWKAAHLRIENQALSAELDLIPAYSFEIEIQNKKTELLQNGKQSTF